MGISSLTAPSGLLTGRRTSPIAPTGDIPWHTRPLKSDCPSANVSLAILGSQEQDLNPGIFFPILNDPIPVSQWLKPLSRKKHFKLINVTL